MSAERCTLAAPETLQQEIRKSRFIAHAEAVATPAEAIALLARITRSDASHHCWAYRIGQQYRFHDDGEPGGTAGKPILAAIDGQGLDRVAVVVIRYFGGIKLGAGGLMRAYGGCAAACLRGAEKKRVVDSVAAHLGCDFATLTLLQARLRELDVAILNEVFSGAGVRLQLEIPRQNLSRVRGLLDDITRGRMQLHMD